MRRQRGGAGMTAPSSRSRADPLLPLTAPVASSSSSGHENNPLHRPSTSSSSSQPSSTRRRRQQSKSSTVTTTTNHNSVAPSSHLGDPSSSSSSWDLESQGPQHYKASVARAQEEQDAEEGEEGSFVGVASPSIGLKRRSLSSQDLSKEMGGRTVLPSQESSSYQGQYGTTAAPSTTHLTQQPPRSEGLVVESSSSSYSRATKATTAAGSTFYYPPPVQPSMGLHHRPSCTSSGLRSVHTTTTSSSLAHSMTHIAPTSLQDFHVVYRNAVHVPDNRYQAYLRGEMGALGRRKDAPPIRISKHCCAHICLGFSLVAVTFLVFVGILLDTQPLLIKGALPRHVIYSGTDDDVEQRISHGKPVTLYKLPADGERLPSATTAYHAALAYFLCAVASFWVLYPHWIQSKFYRFRHRYQNLDLPMTVGGGGPQGSSTSTSSDKRSSRFGSKAKKKKTKPKTDPSLNGGSNHLINGDGSSASLPLYHSDPSAGTRSWWTQFTLMTRHWLAAQGWYQPAPPPKKRRHKTG